MFTADDYSYLEQVIDSTWGQSSTVMSPTMSVKMNVIDELHARITYRTVITYHGHLRQDRIDEERKTAKEVVDEYIKVVKKSFTTLAGHAIKMKLVNLDVNIVDIDMSANRPVRTAYFECHGLIELS